MNFQRHHTLFGSVWSSIRRHGNGTFRRSAKATSSQSNGALTLGGSASGVAGVGGSSLVLGSADPAGGDYLYDNLNRSVADGVNHITRNIMQARLAAAGKLQDELHVAGSGGELRTFGESISMRPLAKNGGAGGGGVVAATVAGTLPPEANAISYE